MTEATNVPSKRVTTADVARASGVSRATVSYVLNDVPGSGISQATRDLVRETAQRLGHVPHGPARSLRLGRSMIVLALVHDYTIGYVADHLIAVLDKALAARGLVLMVHRFDEKTRPLSELWGLVAPDLIVSMGGMAVPSLPSAASPIRLVGVEGLFPHRRAGAMQIEYLHSRGHRRIGYADLDNPRVALIAAERRAGAEDARVKLGLPPLMRRDLLLGDVDAAFAAIDDWLSGPDPITAVAAHNDETAIMLVSALQAKGLRAGRELAVIGVDNIPLARVGITTVEINVDEYAEVILDQVMRAIDGQPDRPPTDRDGFMRLIVRDSA
ncbi:LacI family DNA-binding transcriptional regulator [Mycetocola sp. 2940]|uniref:LacI family DNA-binding transcriptional regulator n=1 Tax=Mycetocola sp. 2940 TaxID=3156452 RepID=UPI0033990C7C